MNKRFAFLLPAMAALLYGIHAVEEVKPALPVELAIKLKPNQHLYSLSLKSLMVSQVPDEEMNHGTTGITFSESKVDPEYLYYPGYNPTQAVKHFQKYLNKYFLEKTGNLPSIQIKAMDFVQEEQP